MADDAAMFLQDEFFEGELSELERRRRLERDGRVAADIEIDLQDKGPLYLYVKERRAAAAAALQRLVDTDPRDATGIATTQAEVMEYLRACDWIHARIEAAEQAEEIIKEEYGDNHDETDENAE